MTDTVTVTVGKRLIPRQHIALVEPFDPSAHPGMKTEKAFKARVVLIDRQSVLTEDPPEAFTSAQGFRLLVDERIGINTAAIRFNVETFAPTEGFEPTKPYKSRLMWRDLEGNTQSKLMLSLAEHVLAIVVKGEDGTDVLRTESRPRGGRKPTASIDRRKARRRAAEPVPF